MESTRFDRLTKALSTTGTRRGAVVATLGGLLVVTVGTDAMAKSKLPR